MHVSLCCVSSRSQYQAPWGLLSAKHHAAQKLQGSSAPQLHNSAVKQKESPEMISLDL